MLKKCNNCSYFDEDRSVGLQECTNEEINEEELNNHFSCNLPDCPYWNEYTE